VPCATLRFIRRVEHQCTVAAITEQLSRIFQLGSCASLEAVSKPVSNESQTSFETF
jgi:hypothetical protein